MHGKFPGTCVCPINQLAHAYVRPMPRLVPLLQYHELDLTPLTLNWLLYTFTTLQVGLRLLDAFWVQYPLIHLAHSAIATMSPQPIIFFPSSRLAVLYIGAFSHHLNLMHTTLSYVYTFTATQAVCHLNVLLICIALPLPHTIVKANIVVHWTIYFLIAIQSQLSKLLVCHF